MTIPGWMSKFPNVLVVTAALNHTFFETCGTLVLTRLITKTLKFYTHKTFFNIILMEEICIKIHCTNS
jgi:hypothetical protein